MAFRASHDFPLLRCLRRISDGELCLLNVDHVVLKPAVGGAFVF